MMPHSSLQDDLAESFQVDAWNHYLGGVVCHSRGLWKWLGGLETGLLSDQIDAVPVHRPVYVTGLARSGSTLLLEVLHRHPDLIAHHYQDYPFLFTPYLWNRYLQRTPRQYAPRERSHRDGIFITPESPEAFEEMLWMAFFPDLHDPGRSAVLDENARNPGFEKFYRDHIRKLLLVRGGRRYLAKGNYNVTRLAYLRRLFDDVRFVIPVRQPLWHIASLMRQQQRFQQGQQIHARALTHVRRVGHFEFGLDRRPINTGDPARTAQVEELWESGAEVEGWAAYWALVHDFIAGQHDDDNLRSAMHIVRYEDFCRSPKKGLSELLAHCGLTAEDSLMTELESMIKPPALKIPAIFKPQDLKIIERYTADAAHRLGLGRAYA